MEVIALVGTFLGSVSVAWLATPLVMTFAERIGAIDKPSDRKIHILPIPRLGGVAVFVAFALSVVIQLALVSRLDFTWLDSGEGVVFFVSLLVIFLLGIWDDIQPLKPLQKFPVQLALASLLFVAGFRASLAQGSFGSFLMQAGPLDYLVTVAWIVGVTNAMNLIDGLDGLASGIAIISSLTILPIAMMGGDIATAVLALMLAGALIGFLRYNFHPARIFLGDSGSLFVGFALAVLSLKTVSHAGGGYLLVLPLLVLGVPIADTLLAIVRRFLRSLLPRQQGPSSFADTVRSIFSPDRSHVHHRLIARGLTHVKAVLVLYCVSIGFGLAALGMKLADDHMRPLILAISGIGLVLGVSRLRYREMAILRNGILLKWHLRIYDSRLLKRTAFQALVDLVLIVIAYSASFFLLMSFDASRSTNNQFLLTLVFVAPIQLIVFFATGLYRGTVHQVGVGDALRNAKSVLMAVLISGLVLGIFSVVDDVVLVAVFILDLYFLLTVIMLSRFAFSALRHLLEKEQMGERRVLIYGANPHGVLIVQNLLGFDSHTLLPVGFIDDDPSLQGKHLAGYPIFGGLWQLNRLLEKHSVNEILLASTIPQDSLRRLKMIARSHGVVIRRFQVRLEDISRAVTAPQEVSGAISVDLSE